MPNYLIIDGYNAINKLPELDASKDKSLERSRTQFIKLVVNFMSQKKLYDKAFVVFDSKEGALGLRRDSYANVEVIFTTAERDADSVIVDLLRASSPSDKICVASDDNFVRNHSKGFGRDIISISELRKEIVLKKKLLGSKITEKDIGQDKIDALNEELKKHWGIR